MIWQPEFTDKTLSRKPGAVHTVSTGIFTWHQSQKSHELFGIGKSRKITQFSNQSYCN
ncbi:hypothetical protein AC21_5557 [Escherichia coli 2-474-04_S3_C2]|nr:hypothetical protein AC21_5557 [Escherichia coli 2-474-04_S3_C2]